MAVLTAGSLLERGGLGLPDAFRGFRRWVAAEPKDIGLRTEDVLGNGEPWGRAAPRRFQVNRRAAGNGSLMRATPAAVYFAAAAGVVSMDAARRLSALTHGDPAAEEGTALVHALLHAASQGDDPLDALPDALSRVPPPPTARYAAVLAPGWHPDQATEFNGAL